MKLSGKEAFEIAKCNPNRLMQSWAKDLPDYPTVPHTGKFKLPAKGNFFTIGSCFARNIENALRNSGVSILSSVPPLPGEYYEIGGDARTGYQNVYTPGSVLEAVSLCSAENTHHSIFGSNDKYFDLLTSGLAPLELDAVNSIRDGLVATYKKLPQADVVIITLGYNESWLYKPQNTYINRTPSHVSLRRSIEDFEFELLGYNECLSLVKRSLEIIHDLSPKCKIILTVSPVPLSATFTDKSVVVANQLSKSTLRTVASALAENFEYVDYFPSYEIIMNSERCKTFLEDGIHVKSEPVSNVIAQFKSVYFS
ncbi:GSCFA domain-containing protein [Pseudomonas sp. Leaf127]|uniref:GSCFA domain-containing protein n=1 Tax=Pseudomonas sp. Leaf127 TaxID=1736267 RepID=UPI0009ECBF30|nr:GSCFA domain-containing protein [Pseudomonas sp. Leaf127]